MRIEIVQPGFVGKTVYVGDLNNFWDVFVICSQLISLCSLSYTLFRFAFKFNKNYICRHKSFDNSYKIL